MAQTQASFANPEPMGALAFFGLAPPTEDQGKISALDKNTVVESSDGAICTYSRTGALVAFSLRIPSPPAGQDQKKTPIPTRPAEIPPSGASRAKAEQRFPAGAKIVTLSLPFGGAAVPGPSEIAPRGGSRAADEQPSPLGAENAPEPLPFSLDYVRDPEDPTKIYKIGEHCVTLCTDGQDAPKSEAAEPAPAKQDARPVEAPSMKRKNPIPNPFLVSPHSTGRIEFVQCTTQNSKKPTASGKRLHCTTASSKKPTASGKRLHCTTASSKKPTASGKSLYCTATIGQYVFPQDGAEEGDETEDAEPTKCAPEDEETEDAEFPYQETKQDAELRMDPSRLLCSRDLDCVSIEKYSGASPINLVCN
jgi:hypothetical protein